MKPAIKHPKLRQSDVPEARAFARLVGEFIEYWGFKAVQGRVWCYLFLSKRPLNSHELAQLAEVSPALITQSVKILLKYKVITEAGKGPNGMLRFAANANAAEGVRTVLASREARLLAKLEGAAAHLGAAETKRPGPSGFALDPARGQQVSQWISLASSILAGGLALLDEDVNPFSEPDRFESPLQR